MPKAMTELFQTITELILQLLLQLPQIKLNGIFQTKI